MSQQGVFFSLESIAVKPSNDNSHFHQHISQSKEGKMQELL